MNWLISGSSQVHLILSNAGENPERLGGWRPGFLARVTSTSQWDHGQANLSQPESSSVKWDCRPKEGLPLPPSPRLPQGPTAALYGKHGQGPCLTWRCPWHWWAAWGFYFTSICLIWATICHSASQTCLSYLNGLSVAGDRLAIKESCLCLDLKWLQTVLSANTWVTPELSRDTTGTGIFLRKGYSHRTHSVILRTWHCDCVHMWTITFTSTSPASVLHVIRGADYSILSQPPKLCVTNLISQMRKTEAQRKPLMVMCLKKLSKILKKRFSTCGSQPLWMVYDPFLGSNTIRYPTY